jgi:hypothetical protein
MVEVDLEELIDAGVPMVVTVEITPDLARRLLQRNRNNRVPKEGAIERYRYEMEEGNWRVTNQGIGFDRNGVLSDGQNRLMACVRAGKSFLTIVAVGLVPEAKEVVDVGVKRTLADALKMEGYTNAPALAGGVALRQRYEQLVEDGRPIGEAMKKGRQWRVLSHPESVEYLRKRESIGEVLGSAQAWRRTFPRCPLSVSIAFESMAIELDQDGLDKFRDGLITGAYLNQYDPRLVLRNYLTRLGATRVLPPTMIILGVTVKAWNAFRLGEPRQILALKETEIMPRMM